MSTTDGVDPDRAAAVVARRTGIVACLADGRKSTQQLRHALATSRSTLYKALRELEELQLVRREGDAYELTLTGVLLHEEYQRHRRAVEDICRPGELLALLPKDIGIGYDLLDGAAVYLTARHAPIQPVSVVEELVREATVLMGIGPVVLPNYVDVFRELLVDGALSAELIFGKPAYEYLTSDYAEAFGAALDSGNLRVHVTADELPFGLLVVEEPHALVAVVVYDEGGGVRGVIENDTEGAYEWGHGVCKRYRERARTVAPDPQADPCSHAGAPTRGAADGEGEDGERGAEGDSGAAGEEGDS
jgi:predicted transcriptional regulator